MRDASVVFSLKFLANQKISDKVERLKELMTCTKRFMVKNDGIEMVVARVWI